MTNNIRTSDVVPVNNIRKILWESIYINMENINILTLELNSQLEGKYRFDLEFDFVNSRIKLTSLDRAFNISEVTESLSIAYKTFIKKMINLNKLDRVYEEFVYTNKSNSLYSVRFLDTHVVYIDL